MLSMTLELKKLRKLWAMVLFLGLSINTQAKWFEIPPLSESFIKWRGPARAALNPEKIDIVVWNILKAKRDTFAKDFAAFGKGTDIFMLQEVANTDNFFKAYEAYPEHQIHFGVSFNYKKSLFKKERILSGTAISSPVAMIDSGMYRTLHKEPFVRTPKVVTWGILPVEGNQDLLIVNIHGLNMTKNKYFKIQMEKCQEIIEGHNGPVIFAGDFNSSNKTKINAMADLARATGLKEVTFKKDDRRRSRFSKLFIDHILYRGLEVKTSRVYGEFDGSDHKAMSASFRVL